MWSFANRVRFSDHITPTFITFLLFSDSKPVFASSAVSYQAAPNPHVFDVDAATAGQGVSQDVIASISQMISDPLFQFLITILAAILILGAYRWRVQRLKVRQEELLRLLDFHTKNLREEKEKTEHALSDVGRARDEAERQKENAQQAHAVIEEQADKLRELDRIKTRFFSNVSHEFRTPLTLIIGPLENLLAGVYGPTNVQTSRQLDIALRNARRLLRLINQLLDLSKLEFGKMDLVVTPGHIAPLVEGVVLSFTAFAERKDLSLSFSCPTDVVGLFFDAACLEKVLFNLLSNAVKFTQDGGCIDVSIQEESMQVDDELRESVTIRVKDSGPGIPEHHLPYVFDRFHQVDGAVANAHEGTGIGLSLVKELVELHHGTISVLSEPGRGSEFIVTLPKGVAHFDDQVLFGEWPGAEVPNISFGPMMEVAVLNVEDEQWPGLMGDGGTAGRPFESVLESPPILNDSGPAASHTHPTAATEEVAAAYSRRARIMIVDDHPEVIEYVASALSNDYVVISAFGGEEALGSAHRLKPDLIISDVMMPGMDGYTLCRLIKADESLRQIPVILLTARGAQDDKIEGLEAGSDDYMSKPFSTRELRARVDNLLTVRDQQRQLAGLNAALAEKNDALREASEMKSQLLNIAAHDMKNPLNAIREFARILKSEIGQDSDHYDPLDLIHKSSDDMLNLVSTLLDSAALENGQIVLVMEPLNLNTLATAVVRRNNGLAENKGQTLELTLSSNRCLVNADRNRLLEAMDNLVNNAVKYSPLNGTIQIDVRLVSTGTQFRVSDEGPGLTDEDKLKIFGKFQKLSAQPTGNETSTGLGLAIVQLIIHMHDGEIFVQSEGGRGTTFTIQLPVLSEREITRTKLQTSWE